MAQGRVENFSILLTAVSVPAAPAQLVPHSHLLHVLVSCIGPRGGGSLLLPLLLTTDSSSHGNHQFSPGSGSLTYTANGKPTKQVSIRRELTLIPACNSYKLPLKTQLWNDCQSDQTNPMEKGSHLHFPSLLVCPSHCEQLWLLTLSNVGGYCAAYSSCRMITSLGGTWLFLMSRRISVR